MKSEPKLTVIIPKSELVNVSTLKENPVNVKIHTDDQIEGIAELIKLEGFISPLVIDKNNMIWAGHGRIMAAKLLQMDKVPCVRLEHLTKVQLKAAMLMDNRINESAWNNENTAEILQELSDFDFEQFHLNFDEFFDQDENFKPEESTEENLGTDQKFRITFEFDLVSDYEFVLQKLKEINEDKEIALLKLCNN